MMLATDLWCECDPPWTRSRGDSKCGSFDWHSPALIAGLDDQDRAHYRDVELGRDYGAEIQVVSGLQDGDTVVVHPGDDILEGTVAEPVQMAR